MDLFNNPTMKSAKHSLSPRTRKKYEDQGKYLYETLNFGSEKVQIDAYLIQKEAALRSGLRPDDLSKEDQEFMASARGTNWRDIYE